METRRANVPCGLIVKLVEQWTWLCAVMVNPSCANRQITFIHCIANVIFHHSFLSLSTPSTSSITHHNLPPFLSTSQPTTALQYPPERLRHRPHQLYIDLSPPADICSPTFPTTPAPNCISLNQPPVNRYSGVTMVSFPVVYLCLYPPTFRHRLSGGNKKLKFPAFDSPRPLLFTDLNQPRSMFDFDFDNRHHRFLLVLLAAFYSYTPCHFCTTIDRNNTARSKLDNRHHSFYCLAHYPTFETARIRSVVFRTVVCYVLWNAKVV
ncbi:hypothetical protein FRC14_005005 [Serendipita sp. 396]|nr:hypothetical protein FRC14_005005 [Serendipita sp. 396]